MTVKLALCINRNDAPAEYKAATGMRLIPIPEGFNNLETKLIDRAVCETDENFLQLLPYIILEHRGSIFCYSRGAGSAEARLRGNLSIGVGGHVDEAPGANGLMPLLFAEAAREIQEETGLANIDHLRLTFFGGLICDPTNAVGRVHMGILVHLLLSDEEVKSMLMEDNIIENGQFMTIKELRAPKVYQRLENWSKIFVDQL